jgi:hypothetical protein
MNKDVGSQPSHRPPAAGAEQTPTRRRPPDTDKRDIQRFSCHVNVKTRRSVIPGIRGYVLPQAPVLPVEDPWNENLADWHWNRWELSHGRRNMQAAVDEVGEGIDLILEVLLGGGVHLLELLNWKAAGAHFCRIEVADLCLQLRSAVSVRMGVGCGTCGWGLT